MFALRTLNRIVGLAPKAAAPLVINTAGMKEFTPPRNYDHVEIPANRQKLRVMLKVPQYNNIKVPKMQKRLILMRGPDVKHNTELVHKQYGIIALEGGRIKHQHIEMARLSIGKKMDTSRMFCVWRIAEPWQPLSKKGIGVRLGAGKGAIDHYCTPVKAGRVIIEAGGKCDFEEVKGFLQHVAVNLPFKAMVVSQEMMEEMQLKKEASARANLNRFTKRYIIMNNMGGCHKWLGKYDHKWFGEYV